MKTRILFTIGLLMFLVVNAGSRDATQPATEKESITLNTTQDLKELSEILVREYQKLNPEPDIQLNVLSVGDTKEITRGKSSLSIVSEQAGVGFGDPSLLTMVVGRDVILPVINAENPCNAFFEEKGVSVNNFSKAVLAENPDWGMLTGNQSAEPLKLYILDDPLILSAISGFLDVNQEFKSFTKLKSADEIIRFVQNDKFAVGFCRLINIAPPGQQELPGNIRLLPLDKNGNGHLDYHENIYSNLDDFKRGIWIGKYPAALVHNIYSLSPLEQADENVDAFLSWVVTSGQQFLEPAGFSELVYNERSSRLDKINRQPEILVGPEADSARSRSFLFILLAVFALAAVSGFVIRNRNKKAAVNQGLIAGHTKHLSEKELSFPEGLYFDKSHTWVHMKKKGWVKFGIDDFIPHVTGKYNRVILKNPGDKVKRKEPIVTLIQDGKQINIHAPVSGIIKEINETLVAEPEAINRSPYKDGWVYMIEPSNWMREIGFFKLGGNYLDWISREIVRLKDFLAGAYNEKNPAQLNVAFQEGGQLIDQPLQNLGPEVWEDFQNYFIETSEMH